MQGLLVRVQVLQGLSSSKPALDTDVSTALHLAVEVSSTESGASICVMHL